MAPLELDEFEQFYLKYAQIWRDLYQTADTPQARLRALAEFNEYNQRLPEAVRLPRLPSVL